jgi:hypothetical protein
VSSVRDIRVLSIARHHRPLSIAIATGVAAVAGAMIGTLVGPGTPQPDRPVTVRIAGAELALPPGWFPTPSRSSAPGLEQGRVVDAMTSSITLAVVPPETYQLLPAALIASRDVPDPARVSAGTIDFWAYDTARPDGVTETVIVAPTTAGIVTLACISQVSAAAADCRTAAGSVRVGPRVAWLDPGRATALRLRLPQIVSALDRERVAARARLAATSDPGRRGAAAASLATAYASAARATAPLAGPSHAELPRLLEDLAASYTALGRASAARAPRAARRAARRIERGESRLQRAFDDLAR